MFPAVGKEIKDLKFDKMYVLYTMVGGLISSVKLTTLIYILTNASN